MPALEIMLLKVGFLAVLWLFVLSAVLVIRRDLSARPSAVRSTARGSSPASSRPKAPAAHQNARQLVVTEGPLAGTRIALTGTPVTIGRADDSTLVLTDDYVSNRHARLLPRDGTWLVEDLGSTNGTYLDHDKVSGATPVPLGVPIRVGKTVLELRR